MADLRLRFLSGSRRGMEVRFPYSPVRLGRGRDNDLIVPETGAPETSALHAAIVRHRRGWYLEDRGSTNGTSVNGRAVVRCRLRDGDQIALGGPPLLLVRVTDRQRLLVALLIGTVSLVALLLGVGRLSLHAGATFADVAARSTSAVYLLAVADEHGARRAIGTGFAVGSTGLVATCAHVIDELVAGRTEGSRPAIVARVSDQRGEWAVTAVLVHPAYRSGSIRADVGLVRLSPAPTVPGLVLGGEPVSEHLGRGAHVAVLGFPAATTDPGLPRAHWSEDVIGDVRGDFLALGLGSVPGMSGSPILSTRGEVVGLLAGRDPAAQAGEAGPSWGIAVTPLVELLQTAEKSSAWQPCRAE